jgi:hypothetical protein
MNRLLRYALLGIAPMAMAGLGACDRAPVQSQEAPRVSATAPAATGTADPTPKSGEVFKEGAPPEKTTTHAARPDPQAPMTTEEEKMAMPKPGQANDHSNPAAQPATSERTQPQR